LADDRIGGRKKMGLRVMGKKREPTQKQLEVLKRGRDKLARKRKLEKKREEIRKNKRESMKRDDKNK
jgi:hypothetical protein